MGRRLDRRVIAPPRGAPRRIAGRAARIPPVQRRRVRRRLARDRCNYPILGSQRAEEKGHRQCRVSETTRQAVPCQNSVPSSIFTSSSSDIIVSASGTTGASVAAARKRTASFVTGTRRIVRTTSTLFTRSARDWMSPLPTKRSSAGAPPRSHLASNSPTYRSASVPYSRPPVRFAWASLPRTPGVGQIPGRA